MAVKMFFGKLPSQYVSEIQLQTYQPQWIEIDNTIVGLNNIEITVRKGDGEDNNNVTQESLSSSLKFYDGAYDFLAHQLVTLKREAVYVKLENDCAGCDKIIHFGIIKREKLRTCDCENSFEAEVQGISKDEIIKARLESIILMDDYLANNWIDGMAQRSNTNVIFQLLQDRFSGLRQTDKYGVPGIPIRTIMNRIAQRLNFNVYSSIFYEYNQMMQWSGDDYSPTVIPQGYNPYNPYYYLYMVYMPIVNSDQKARQTQTQVANEPLSSSFFEAGVFPFITNKENWLNWTPFKFLNALSGVFNAKWRLKNGDLQLERKDFFELGKNLWLNLTEYKACYNIKDFNNFSYFQALWSGSKQEVQSSINPRSVVICTGNPITDPWYDTSLIYVDDATSWQDTLTLTRRSGKIKQFEFGYAPSSRYNGQSKVSLKNGYTPHPCLYVGSENSAINRKFIWGGFPTFEHQPMTTAKYTFNFCDNLQTNTLIKENLYDNFHFIDDPRQLPNSKGYVGKNSFYDYEYEIENIPFNCDDWNNFDINKTIKVKKGEATMDEVTFNFSKRLLTIKGKV